MKPISAIDSHQHFWDPEKNKFPWMMERHRAINRRFSADDLAKELPHAGVSKTVLVQTGASYESNWTILRTASETEFVAGVVGWVDLASPDVSDRLDRLLDSPFGKWLVGIRHPVDSKTDPSWLLRRDAQRGLTAVAERSLAFDLLVRQRELPAALRTIEAFPEMRFVVDHIANPDIRCGEFEAWSDALMPFSDHNRHVWCKLSGMVTLADWANWRPEQIRPFIRKSIEIFGPERCMFGSDWPVCLLAASYCETIELVRTSISRFPVEHQEAILRDSAIEAYQLDDLR